ncbi:hypothetical protein [Pseudomonas sp. NPDC089534]
MTKLKACPDTAQALVATSKKGKKLTVLLKITYKPPRKKGDSSIF